MMLGGIIAAAWATLGTIHERRDHTAYHCQKADPESCEGLKANIRAARANEDSVDLAVWSIGLNILGLGGLGLTIFYAHRAWKESQRSANAAHETLEDARADAAEQAERFRNQLDIATRAADAATKQAVVAEDTAKKQLRAYLYVEFVELKWLRGAPCFYVRFRNTGATPAVNVSAGGIASLNPSNETVEVSAIVGLSRHQFVGANTTRRAFLYTVGGDNIKREDLSASNILNLSGRVEYDDIFGERCMTEFVFYTHSPEPGEDGMIMAAGHRAAFKLIGRQA